jgi:hypothetical protein
MRECPYGKPGERLWVRENYSFKSFEEVGIDDYRAVVRYLADDAEQYVYQCDAPADVGFWPGAKIRKYEGENRPNIFMYRWVSRITLEITDVRVQRLQEISEEDSLAEGCKVEPIPAPDMVSDPTMRALAVALQGGNFTAKFDYEMLWNDINGADAWNLNPWVWAITFKRVQA